MILFGNKLFADLTRFRSLGQIPIQYDWYFCKKGKFGQIHTEGSQHEDAHVMPEAEISLMHLRARGCQE